MSGHNGFHHYKQSNELLWMIKTNLGINEQGLCYSWRVSTLGHHTKLSLLIVIRRVAGCLTQVQLEHLINKTTVNNISVNQQMERLR